jgi:hypothetical protein
MLSSCSTMLGSWLRAHMQARRRRIEHEKEFYRQLAVFCRANNLPSLCEDDWKSAQYARER